MAKVPEPTPPIASPKPPLRPDHDLPRPERPDRPERPEPKPDPVPTPHGS
jgi:hypothetical protein